MINASQIKENMEVKSSDGKHVGTVLGVEDGRCFANFSSDFLDKPSDVGASAHGVSSPRMHSGRKRRP